jgi:hypothetical protein
MLRMKKAMKNSPNGTEPRAGSTNAFFTGLPFHRILSSGFNSLSSLDKGVHLVHRMSAIKIKDLPHVGLGIWNVWGFSQ